MSHIVLLGDSIFDNARYVPGEPPVLDQLRERLPPSWTASLLAVDGHITADVMAQADQLPADATHVVVSCGGNDALHVAGILSERASSVLEVMGRFSRIRAQFQRIYKEMLSHVQARCPRVVVCTVYDHVPGMQAEAMTALSMFNEVILREAVAAKVPVVDLRLICEDPADYSPVSPIEPSSRGGDKISRAIVYMLQHHDFEKPGTVIY